MLHNGVAAAVVAATGVVVDAAAAHYSLLPLLVLLVAVWGGVPVAVVAGIGFKRARMIGMKNQLADANSLSSTAYLAEASQSQFTSRAHSQAPQVLL